MTVEAIKGPNGPESMTAKANATLDPFEKAVIQLNLLIDPYEAHPGGPLSLEVYALPESNWVAILKHHQRCFDQMMT